MLEQLKLEIESAIPGCRLELVTNPSVSAQHSVLLDPEHAVAVALFLRDAPAHRYDFCSNVTGIDWPPLEVSEKVKVTKLVDGVETQVDELRTTESGDYLEAV
jgi:NADH-quinone oxidoreductase subunit C